MSAIMGRASVIFLFIFAASVSCAVVCLDEALDSMEHGGGGCTQCISTDFWASSKASDVGTMPDVPANPATVLTVTPALLITRQQNSRVLNPQLFLPPAITALRI
jgi:hypothetical protein